MDLEKISSEAAAALHELCEVACFRPGSLLIIDGSSSEIRGSGIGSGSSSEVGRVVVTALLHVAEEEGVELAFQCCEKLDRMVVVERETAEKYGYEEVRIASEENERFPRYGGSMAYNAFYHMEDPVIVRGIEADGGLDIGLCLIGMQLKKVAVPVRLKHNHIGKALVVAARTRPKLIGGERARYERA